MEETEKKQECAGAAAVEAETELHRLREELEEAKRAARADRAALKGRLYRELLRGAGVDEKRIGAILRVTDLDGMTVRDGRLEEEERLTADIRREWADFIGVTKTRGALVETPPAAGRPARTRAEIEAIRDGGERRRAIAENAALFGLEVAY